MRLVDPEGGQIGIKPIEEARWLADQLGLDLVEVAAEARPPVVRMMDYGKFKYEQSVSDREARKKQKKTVVKEVQFRPKIGDSDFAVKRRRVERFLDEGDKVKCTMRFRGREVTHPELGKAILDRLFNEVEELAVIETNARLDGRQMTMVLAPAKRPSASEAAPVVETDTADDTDAADTDTAAGTDNDQVQEQAADQPEDAATE